VLYHPQARNELRPPQNNWNINVLVVEDDPADTSLILNVLRRHPGVSSAHAIDSPDVALEQLRAGHLSPDLVLLDIHMPRIDGFGFLESLRKIPAMARTPVVFLTTSCLASDVVEARHCSASSYVIKPDTYAELQTRLDAVIRKAVSGAWSK
jgi:two-component system chemotaxis response regulator CheY